MSETENRSANRFEHWLEYQLDRELGPVSSRRPRGLPRYRALLAQGTEGKQSSFLTASRAGLAGFVAAFALSGSGAVVAVLTGQVTPFDNSPIVAEQTTTSSSSTTDSTTDSTTSDRMHIQGGGGSHAAQANANANPQGNAFGLQCNRTQTGAQRGQCASSAAHAANHGSSGGSQKAPHGASGNQPHSSSNSTSSPGTRKSAAH